MKPATQAPELISVQPFTLTNAPLPPYSAATPSAPLPLPATSARLALPWSATACRQARETVRDMFTRWGLEALADVAQLLVSELIGNSLQHACGPLGLSLRRDTTGVRCLVSDGSVDPPRLLQPDLDAEHGRGMRLVDTLAARWGADCGPTGKSVWFELLETSPTGTDKGVPVGVLTGLPAELTAFVGRSEEVAEVRKLLSASRLVTLSGAGGVGKTRLGLRVAAAAARGFPDGVALVELAKVHEAGLLARSIAAAMGLQNQAGRGTIDEVAGHLRGKRLLLVLDNCEHLADACARAVDVLLRTAPDLRVLATSRHILGITGERVFTVPPLPVPAPGACLSVTELLEYPAVPLFEQRAAAVMPGFRVDKDNAEAIGRLVRHLEGLPLAIELAAARMRSLSLPQILDRLDNRFTLLVQGCRSALPRQRTLRALIDWSYTLCSEQERTLWARLSVFSGGFDLQDAMAVCAGPDLPGPDTADLVHGLVEKSVLTCQEQGERVRYRMLETVREYGQDRLTASGALAEFRRRHRDHYVALTAQARAQWFGPEQVSWLTRLRVDHANLCAALDYCLTTPGEAAVGMVLAVTPPQYWMTGGSPGEGRDWLARLLAADRADSPPRTAALGAYGHLKILTGPVDEAMPVVEEYREAATRLHDTSALAWAQHHYGLIAAFRGDMVCAKQLFRDAIRGHRALGDLPAATECMVKLAVVECLAGDTDQALALARQCQSQPWIRGHGLFVESLIRRRTGDRDAADTLARQALRLLHPLNDRWSSALCVEIAAWSAAAAGRPERAAHLLGIRHSLWGAVGDTRVAAPFMIESHRQCENQVRAALPTKTFDRAFHQGAAFTPVEALGYVLEERTRRTSTPARTDGGPAVSLTRREREVAELVAAGMTNKEIAAELVVAQRTAENHVQRILAKLGLTSRCQLAAWIYEHRITTSHR